MSIFKSLFFVFFACFVFASTSLQAMDGPTREQLRALVFEKKPPSMAEKLNINKLLTGMLMGSIDKIKIAPETLFAFLEEASLTGDEDAELNLYRFLKQPIGKINQFVDKQRADELLVTGCFQEPYKFWALKEAIAEHERTGSSSEAQAAEQGLDGLLAKAIRVLTSRRGNAELSTDQDDFEYWQLLKTADAFHLTNGRATQHFLDELARGRLWALREKIKQFDIKRNGVSADAVIYLIKAAHRDDQDATKLLTTYLGDKIAFAKPSSASRWDAVKNRYSLKRYFDVGFGDKPWTGSGKPWILYGKPLHDIGLYLIDIGNFDLAERYLKAAIRLGHAASFPYLAEREREKGNFDAAFDYAQQGRKLGNLDAELEECQIIFNHLTSSKNLAMVYARMLRFPIDGKELSRDLGAVDLLTDLESMSFEGHERNELRAIELARYSAEHGSTLGMVILADLERTEFPGHPANFAEALKWYYAADKNGQEGMAGNIAALELETFPGHERNPGQAYAKFKRAYEEDDQNDSALAQLADLERLDFGGHRANKRRAFELAKKAALNGNCCAMALVGELEDCTFSGHKRNPEAAKNWTKKAALKNCSSGMKNIDKYMSRDEFRIEYLNRRKSTCCVACMMEAGRLENKTFPGHQRNFIKAITWFTEAAKRGSADAKFELGKIHLELGSDRHLGQALFWLREAQADGSQQATNLLESFSVQNVSDNIEDIIETILETPVVVTCEERETCVTSDNAVCDGSHDAARETVGDNHDDSDGAEPEIDENLASAYASSLDFSQYDDKLVNKKALRTAAVKTLTIMNQNLTMKRGVRVEDLHVKNQALWHLLKTNDFDQITYNELFRFASDDALSGMFSYGPTKKGVEFTLVVVDGSEKRHGSVGTHQKHNKSYKGINHDFLREFRAMVENVLQW